MLRRGSCLLDEGGIDALHPYCLHVGLSVSHLALTVGKSVLDLSVVGDSIIAVVHCSLSVSLVVCVLASIFCSVFAAIVSLAVL